MSEKRLVAIVDDDPGVRGSVDSLLRSIGLSSILFPSAEELLAWGDYPALACVVSDVHMEGMTGLALQAEMKRLGWSVPLILMTAYPTGSAEKYAHEHGATAFLVKPVNPDHLIAAIERALL